MPYVFISVFTSSVERTCSFFPHSEKNVQCYYVRFDYCLYLDREYWLTSHAFISTLLLSLSLACFGMLYRKDWLPLFDMNYSPLISISCIVLHVQCPDYKKTRELFSSFLHKLNSAPLLGNCCTSDIERTGFFFYIWIKLLSIFF